MNLPAKKHNRAEPSYSLKAVTPIRPVFSLRLVSSTNARKHIFTRKRLALAGVIAFAVVFFGTWISGHASYVVDAYPVVELSEKTTTLHCNYSGQEISVDLRLHGNVNNYYHNRADKTAAIKSGDYKRFIYENARDDTIDDLADKIRAEARVRSLSDDQLLELAGCFIQNIPYDDVKASAVLAGGAISDKDLSQHPYETLYKNSGICTDKTYLGSLLLQKLGYSTGIYLFPEDEHMALAVSVPAPYTSFGSKYTIFELTNTGFAPGELPTGIDDNDGRPSVSINTLNELSLSQDPTQVNYQQSNYIDAPTLVIDVNEGKSYNRIAAVKNLKYKISNGLSELESKTATLNSAYNELVYRDNAQESAYSYYLSLPSTTYECGYQYNYSYSYSLYSYSSPYTYECGYVPNKSKDYAYDTYSFRLSSYNSYVYYYNALLDSYNAELSTVQADINSYKAFDYN